MVEPLIDKSLALEIERAIARVLNVDRVVVTHGDPGSGKYLYNPSGTGVLLDWETASVSPFGLDLGRAAFIGLLDLGCSGIPHELIPAMIRGYSNACDAADRLDQDLLRAWIVVGGLQFIHGRHAQPLRPDRTARMAADVLAEYLSESLGDPVA